MEKSIRQVHLELWSESDIEDYSVVECTIPGTFSNGDSPNNSLYDLKMGPTFPSDVCKSCFQGVQQCPGHFGCIKLAVPVFNIFFFDVILKTLKKICLQCSSLVSKKACHQCHAPTEKIRKKNTYTILHNQDPFTTSEIRLLFANLSFENAQKLGWNVPPVRAVPKILAVPPPCVRPSARMTNGKWCCSDLTYKYSEIIKVNNVLKSLVYGNYPKHIIMDSWIKLQWHVSTLFDNSAKDFNIANARRTLPVEGYKQRLSGKEGRIRCHLMGKRVDFSARTVITPDPNLDLDEVGVPKQIALSLTKPETVTSFNLEEMVQRIRAGPKSLQGAKYLIIKGQKFDLTVARIEKVSVGDIIERPLKNGDIVVMNRQPTLHKMSMMAHRVKIMVRSAMPFFVPQHTH